MGWKLTTREELGGSRVTVTLHYGSRVVGMVNMSRAEYDGLCKFVMSTFVKMVGQELQQKISEKLWQDAQRACHEDVEAAKERLVGFGWTLDGIRVFAHEMTLHLAERLLGELPEYIR